MLTDIFTPHLHAVPAVLREVDTPLSLPPGLRARQVVYKSLSNEVYALIVGPDTTGRHPGLLLLHGGKGSAEIARAIEWAQLGYVVVTPDLPGIADPTIVPSSSGAWKQLPYGEGRWQASPDATTSTIFQAVVAALNAFNLLVSDPGVDAKRAGVYGISWGGYTTTMMCALLGDRVRAGFSLYGCGFYEHTTFSKSLESMPEAERNRWYASLDAGRRASKITAPFFVATASNDTFFWPPAVEKTLATIPGQTGRLYAPNADHAIPVPGGQPEGQWAEMAPVFFDYHLNQKGAPFPRVKWDIPGSAPGTVSFRVEASLGTIVARACCSSSGPEWSRRKWVDVEVRLQPDGSGTIRIPDEFKSGDHCFVMITDERPVSVSSPLLELA